MSVPSPANHQRQRGHTGRRALKTAWATKPEPKTMSTKTPLVMSAQAVITLPNAHHHKHERTSSAAAQRSHAQLAAGIKASR